MRRFWKAVLPVFLVLSLLSGSALAEAPKEELNGTEQVEESEKAEAQESENALTAANRQSPIFPMGTVADDFTEDRESMLLYLPSHFHRLTYTDRESGYYIHYNLFLPEKYDPKGSYPLVVFLNDSYACGTELSIPLLRGIGPLVWASAAWQSVNPTIVAVPLYREPIVDEQSRYQSEYVGVTRRFIDLICRNYAVDKSRIYGTGQGMGSSVVMLLASDHPDLFAACMFVGGRWSTKPLARLESQKFIYFSSESDRYSHRMEENLLDQLSVDGARYAHSLWDGSWTAEERTTAALKMSTSSSGHYFICWLKDSIETSSDDLKRAQNDETDALRVATYNKAYDCVAMMEWLFQQTKAVEEAAKTE